jgi:hypothetical protein
VVVSALLLKIVRLAIFVVTVLFISSLSGQQRSPSSDPIIPVIGTVRSISGNQINVESESRIIVVRTDNHTEVWKGKTSHDLALIHVGDDFAGRCRADASGRLLADLIELNVIAFFGVVTRVDGGGDSFEIFTNPKADPQSGYEKKRLRVLVDADTIFTASAKEDLKTGREVQMVGVDLKDGAVRATRLTVYEGDWPIRMRDGKVLPPTGPPK